MVAGIFFAYSLLTLLVADGVQSAADTPVSTVQARVFLTGSANVSGTLNLTEMSNQTGVHFVGQVTGLTPGKHGFHVHQFGDVSTDGCTSTGAHYNPISVFHGSREADKQHRHAGDEGNIVADNNGIANIDFVDPLVSLIPNSKTGNNIVGRGLVVHALEDDLGLGGNDGSLSTGNAGARLACGVIGIVYEDLKSTNSGGKVYCQIPGIVYLIWVAFPIIFRNQYFK